KTDASRRQVALTVAAVTALRQHRTRQLEERLALGGEWDDRGLVFCNLLGRPIEASNLLQREFYPLLKRAGLPHVRFHDLRHTAATLLLLQGIHPKVVSEMLGHSQIGITMNLYSHVLPNMQRDATAAMDRLLGS
ncbi:MAG TPA: tyrosine-type recombinase/integrase, partial [Ktedonobacterales bacterium]